MLDDFQTRHAQSITDENPALVPTPDVRVTRVVCCVPVRKPPHILQALVATIAAQQTRVPVELETVFWFNYPATVNTGPHTQIVHEALPNARIIHDPVDGDDDYGQKAETRLWTKPAFERMATIKDTMLEQALAENFDFVWLLDADVLCDPYTLQSLLDTAGHEEWLMDERAALPIVAGVYWTRWQRPRPETRDFVHAGPQVWLVHPYQLHGRGWTEATFREALIERQRVRVWGLGACTLIPRSALAHGVRFAYFDGLPPGPMSEGEDRHFCARATQLHVPMIADAWPDIYHAYHPEEDDAIPQQLDRLRVSHAAPRFGDLVSGRVAVLDPIPDQLGRLMRPSPQWIRGRLGSLPVLPQIEETLALLQPGESRLIKLQYPAHYSEPQLRGGSAIARVSLYDSKPFRMPPVVEHELLVGQTTGRFLDATTYTAEQLEDLTHD